MTSETPALAWTRAHEELSRLARSRAALNREEGHWLLSAARARVHVFLGYGGFAEYVERLFGYKPRTTEEKLRVAEALEGLPLLSRSLEQGELNWSAVRELTRVATPDTEQDWLRVARGKTLRQVEQWVSGRSPGDGPDAPARSESRRHMLAFQVQAETMALFREALAKLRRDAGEPIDDDAALLLMARQVLGGPTDTGRASYQIAVTRCEECGRGFQSGKGEALPVTPDVMQMAECDAQHIGSIESTAPVGAEPPRATQDVPPKVRRHILRRDGQRCVVPGCKNAIFLDIHHLDPRSEGGTHDPDGLVTLCGAHHRAQHRGQLVIEGRVATGLGFRHADGTPYGQLASPSAVDVRTRVFAGLRSMGFRETEVRRVLAELTGRAELAGAGTERLLRAALGVLTPSAPRSAPG